MAWIAYDFAGMRTVLFGDESTYRNFGKELCLITLSHRGDLDWVGGYIVAVQFGFLQVGWGRRRKWGRVEVPSKEQFPDK